MGSRMLESSVRTSRSFSASNNRRVETLPSAAGPFYRRRPEVSSVEGAWRISGPEIESRSEYPARMKRRGLRRLAIWSAVLLLGGPLLYVLAAVGLALIPVNKGFVDSPDGVEIFLVSNGIHVDFLVPVKTPAKDWSEMLPRESFKAVDDESSRILFGWGDRGFYLETPTWSDLKVTTVLNAVFWPSASVVHAEYFLGDPISDDSCRRVRLSEKAYRELCTYLESSFRKDSTGRLVLIPGKSYHDTDNFYEGEGSYHAFNTCNLWANRGLKKIGVRTALWSPFAGGILRHVPAK